MTMEWLQYESWGEVEENFDFQRVVGAGVYGTVHKACCRVSGRIVALKHVTNNSDETGQGIPTNILREITLMRDLRHPNVVSLLGVSIRSEADLYLILEFADKGDLSQLLKQHQRQGQHIPMPEVRLYVLDLINGLHACHLRMMIHRDLKPKNLLLSTGDGRDVLKIADFGLARGMAMSGNRVYTPEVVTLWYRAPELLLGLDKYGSEVDMWSAGAIAAEMITNRALFPGDSEIGTLFVIFKRVGTPTEDTWPGFTKLQYWNPRYPKWPPTGLQSVVHDRPELGPEGGEFLLSLLTLDPRVRCNARKAKSSGFLTST